MRQIITITILLFAINSFGQDFEKGIYKGKKLPFEICYFNYDDTLIQVEYFYEKAGQIFANIPAKRVKTNLESFSTKPALKSDDDSIKVFFRKDHFLIQKVGSGKIKVYKTNDKESDILILRNRSSLFKFTQDLFDTLKVKQESSGLKFNETLKTYELEKYINQEPLEFKKKLEITKAEIIKNWR